VICDQELSTMRRPRERKTAVVTPVKSAEETGGLPNNTPRRRFDGMSAWLTRPATLWGLGAVLAVILAAPWWLMSDDLRYFILTGDDFAYVADALDWSIVRAHLFKPHNAHVVPLFRLWTYALVSIAGRLERLPDVFGPASYLGLVVAMILTGFLAARESGRTAVGLAAMILLGVSTVERPAVAWYSAGQALWAGAAIVLTVILARSWSVHGGAWRLGLVVLGALAAPAIWSGGLMAGPTAMAYLWSRRALKSRAVLLLLAGVSAAAVLLVTVISRSQIAGNRLVWEVRKELWPRPIQAVFHTAQAIIESLVLGNFGLDAFTTHWQAVVIVLGLVGLWAWSRGWVPRFNSLEATGATIVVGSYLLVYFFRGNFPYSSLREVDWYNATPQIGAVLFAVGWWSGLRPVRPSDNGRLTRGEAIALLGLAGFCCVIQVPRAERSLIRRAPEMSDWESQLMPVPDLQRVRALYFKEEIRDRQVRAFARLDRAQAFIGRLGTGPKRLREVFGRVLVPGIPERQISTDAFSVLRLPPDHPDVKSDPERLHEALDSLIQPEAEPRPPWLLRSEPWPRPASKR
jgi:hypothetical protein